MNTLLSLPKKILMNLIPDHYHFRLKSIWRSLFIFGLHHTIRGFLSSNKMICDENLKSKQRINEAKTNLHKNPFESYFYAHMEGPGIWKWIHYFDIYHRHFEKFRNKEVHILEIGIYSGGSFDMWKDYFGDKCHIYGVDIEETCKIYEKENIKVFIGDQSDRQFWKKFKNDVSKIDIIIDDGSHIPHQQIVTLEELFPLLSPGGVYFCEDVHGILNPFHCYINGLSYRLNSFVQGEKLNSSLVNSFQASVSSMHLYPYVVVIEKRETSLMELASLKQGTEWQPFLDK